MVLDAETVERIRKSIRDREAPTGPERARSRHEIEIEVQGLTFQATNPRKPDVVIPVDEDGPSPGDHFLTGAGA